MTTNVLDCRYDLEFTFMGSLRNSSKSYILMEGIYGQLRNEFDFWKVHGIMNTSGLLQS